MDLKDLRKIKSNSTNVKVRKVKNKKEVNRKVISFDIGSENTKIVVGRHYKGKIEIEKMFCVSTPHDSIMDGNIVNLPSVVNFVEQKLKNEKIKIKDAICTNNSTAIINREIIIPKVEDDEIDTVVKFEIQQYLPLNMNDYIIQSNVLEEIEEEGQPKFRTLVLTYPEKMSYNYYKLLTDVNLKPVALDITYNSLNKLTNYCNKINKVEYSIDEAIAFIDMGANSLNVQIYKNGKLDFSRIIKSGGSNIDVMLSKVLQIKVQEAEREKISKGSVTLNPENMVDDIIKIVVEEWIGELQRIIQFYKNKKLGNSIYKIYLYGGSSNLKGIQNYMDSRLKIRVEKVESIDSVKINSSFTDEKICKYLNAIGAIIRL